MTNPPAILPKENNPIWPVIGDRIRCLIDGKGTGGAFSLFEVMTPPGAGSPPHIHHREEETFHVLEGQVEFWIDGKTTLVGPGATVFAPRDVPHCFRNPGHKPIRMLMVASPAGLEHFFARTAAMAPEPPPPMPAFAKLAAEYGLELLPPR